MAIHLVPLILLTFSIPTISTSPLALPSFSYPKSTALDYTNLLIGNGGDEPNFTGGMIPSVSPPFGMTRWVAQTQIHYVSATPYSCTLDKVMGLVGTRQPAIWMGESAQISVSPGVGNVVVDFQKRGLMIKKNRRRERSFLLGTTVSTWTMAMEEVFSCCAISIHILRYAWICTLHSHRSRSSICDYFHLSPTNITYPLGSVSRPNGRYEICGYSSERQDSIIAPVSIAPAAAHFKGYFCARFEQADEQKAHPPVFVAIQNGSVTRPFEQGTYSIWDTYRAAWAWQVLFVPKKVPGMIWSMLEDYKQSGWLPMWKNIVETNMIGTHADSLIAEAVLKDITSGFDMELAWEAVWKDATVPPENDWEKLYDDREKCSVDFEVRVGLSSVFNDPFKGWVADDVHSERASRTLAYSYDDFAAYVLANALQKPENVTEFPYERAMRTSLTLFNDKTGFIEARNKDGSWAGDTRGWTEGDKWAYTFDVVHNIPELIKRRGGKIGFVQSLEAHFNGGHNEHSNEPSHHIPYLCAMSGAAFKTQERVREIALVNYNNTPNGLSGVSAWYIFSAMGLYPVNPVSGEYVVGSPFFEKISIELDVPSTTGWLKRKLSITAPGARTRPYIKSLTINDKNIQKPIIKHAQLIGWESDLPKIAVVFEMSDKIENWGKEREVLEALGVASIPVEVIGDDDDREAVLNDRLLYEEL